MNMQNAAMATKTGTEKGAWSGFCTIRGGKEKNPSGNPRTTPPASGRTASRNKAVMMISRLFMPKVYHGTATISTPAGVSRG